MSDEMSLKITNRFKKELYEDFVFENPNTSIFQTLEMAEVYKRNKNCTPLVLAAIDEDTGEIAASLLAKILAEKSGFLSSFSKHSTIRGGPIFKGSEEGILATVQLLQHYNEIVKKEALYSRIYPLNDTPQIVPAFRDSGYEYGDWQNFLIDLTKSKDELWKNLKRDKRQAINKARRIGVQITEAADKEEVSIFYNLVKERQTKRENPFEDISHFEAVFDLLVPKNRAKFLFAKYGNEYIATRLVLLYKDMIYAWYIGSNSEYFRYHPNDLLVWHVLEWGSENGFRVFDFGGGGEKKDLDAGWVEFKRRFGGRLINYGRYTKTHQPIRSEFTMKMFKVYKKIFLRRNI